MNLKQKKIFKDYKVFEGIPSNTKIVVASNKKKKSYNGGQLDVSDK